MPRATDTVQGAVSPQTAGSLLLTPHTTPNTAPGQPGHKGRRLQLGDTPLITVIISPPGLLLALLTLALQALLHHPLLHQSPPPQQVWVERVLLGLALRVPAPVLTRLTVLGALALMRVWVWVWVRPRGGGRRTKSVA